MERTEILEAMGTLKLYGMRAAFDEIVTTAVKRQHEPQRVRASNGTPLRRASRCRTASSRA